MSGQRSLLNMPSAVMKTSEEVAQPSAVAIRHADCGSSQMASRISVPYRMWGARSYFSTTWAM